MGCWPQDSCASALALDGWLLRPGEFLTLLRTGRAKDEPVHDVGNGVRRFARFAIGKAVVANMRIDDELIPLSDVRGQGGRGLAKGGKEEAGDDFLLVGAAIVIADQAKVEIGVVALLFELGLFRNVAHGDELKAM